MPFFYDLLIKFAIPFFASIKKIFKHFKSILEYIKFTYWRHIYPNYFWSTDRTGIFARYNSTDEYLSDSSSCTDNKSDLRSDDYNDYESNYELDNEEASRNSTSTI